MRIVLFTDTLGDLNGVTRFIQDMGELAYNGDNKHNIELHIVTSTSKTLPEQPYIHNLPYRFRIPMPFYQEMDLVLPNKKAIKAKLEALKPDVVHISTPGPFGWQAKNIAQKMGYPLVGTYHTDFPAYMYDLTGMKWVKHQTDRLMARFYKPFVHVFSRSVNYLEVMANDLNIEFERASALSPGTHLAKFHPQHKMPEVWEHFGLHNGRKKVLYVGRMNIEKNIPFLVDVWATMMTKHPELKADLILVGEGRYRKWADKLRDKHIYFLGPIVGQRLSQIYASSDVFVFPSITDTLGQVIMEAQASGIGCIVSDIGGPQTLVVENHTGLVISANQQQEWIDALYSVMTEKNMTQTWGGKSRTHIEQYNIEDSFTHFIEVHKMICK